MRRSDESTVSPQRVVTQLDYAKIGPDFGPNAQDLPEKVWPWAFRHGLCEEQRHRGRRPRHPGVAMHEEVRICLCRQPAPERKQLPDMFLRGRQHSRSLVDNVVEPEFQTGVLPIGAEGRGCWPTRVEDR
jgi:hypothetical protein